MPKFLNLYRRWRQWRQDRAIASLITNSGLFDPEFYRAVNLDVALSGEDPLRHFIAHGRREVRRPSLDFDPSVYLAGHPDVRRAGIDPFLHYLRNGQAEGRSCRNSGLSKDDLPGALARIRSSGLFDSVFYLRQCPAVRAAGIDPLFHYVVSGFTYYVDPSPAFSTSEYLLAHPDVHKAGLNPLLHFISSGRTVEKNANIPVLDTSAGKRSGCQPDYRISSERMSGIAYFHRYLFSFDPAESPAPYVDDAIEDLSCRPPKLRIESIEPEVTIIIPVSGQLSFLLNCLDSLSKQSSRFSAEIILAVSASSQPEQARRLETIPWIRYLPLQSNKGFFETFTEAARFAHGRFLVLLDSGTRVAADWLDELIGSFNLFPKAGLISSKLLNSDGALQAAAGIPWRRENPSDYGNKDDPYHPNYCFARQVDFVSGTSIAVSTEIWNRLDGFGLTSRPAYPDLAFRLRAAGYEIWLQPLSEVLHYDGKACTLAGHTPDALEPVREPNLDARDRILVLDAVTPTPDRDSGSFITVRILKAFQMLGYRITFIPQHDYLYSETYTRDLQRLGVECLYRPYFRSFTEVLDFRSDFDVVLAFRVNVLGQLYDEIRRRMPSARIIFHNVDLHFLREEREAELSGSRSRRISAALTRAAELELIAKVDCTIVHTNAEEVILKQNLPISNIIVFPYIAELHRTQVQFEDRHDIMFLGGFRHTPNIDAVKHFSESLWPLLLERLPGHARFIIVGSSAPDVIQSLAGPRILVTGYVEDLQPYFDAARVFVAPLRYGAGIKGKVIQSLCYGTPSVITSIAAEGIGFVSGRETIIADGDLEFAEEVVRIYSDRALWVSLQAAGYHFVEKNFSWERCLDLCTNVLDTADATWLARHERTLRVRLARLIADASSTDASQEGREKHL